MRKLVRMGSILMLPDFPIKNPLEIREILENPRMGHFLSQEMANITKVRNTRIVTEGTKIGQIGPEICLEFSQSQQIVLGKFSHPKNLLTSTAKSQKCLKTQEWSQKNRIQMHRSTPRSTASRKYLIQCQAKSASISQNRERKQTSAFSEWGRVGECSIGTIDSLTKSLQKFLLLNSQKKAPI